MPTSAEILAARAELRRAELMGEAADIVRRGAGSSLPAEYEARVESIELAVETLDERAKRYRSVAENYATTAKIRREAMTYRPDVRHSWFFDQVEARRGDTAAADRLKRHGREMDVELRERAAAEERAFRSSIDAIGAEYRTASRIDGQGGDLVPPLWLISDTAMQPAAARPLANLVGSTPLPEGTDSINIPRLVAGDNQAIQTADNAAALLSEPTDSSATAPVVTIESISDVSQQLIDQVPAPGLDGILFRSARIAADAVLEAQLLAGSGVNGQICGLANVSSVGGVTYTDATPTPAELYAVIMAAVATVNDARLLPAECILLRGARWAWLCAATDGGLEQNGPGRGWMPSLEDLRSGDLNPIGPISGHPVYINNAISATQGSGSNQDSVIITRPSDHMLWEAAPRMSVLLEPGAGTLTARISTRFYVAFTGALFPSATAVVTGNGLIVQSGW